MLYADPANEAVPAGQLLFVLDGVSADDLTLGSDDRDLAAEAYGPDLSVFSLALKRPTGERGRPGLYPNPTSGPVSYRLPLAAGQGGELTLRITDGRGRLVTQLRRKVAEGEHRFGFGPESGLERPGLYYLTATLNGLPIDSRPLIVID